MFSFCPTAVDINLNAPSSSLRGILVKQLDFLGGQFLTDKKLTANEFAIVKNVSKDKNSQVVHC